MPSRAGLDRETVIQAAAQLMDETGGEVSMAALAARLGVRPPSLYNHIAGQEGLRRDLALRGLRELAMRLMRAAAGRTDDDALVAVARAYRGFGREHPGLYTATLRAPDPEDRELDAVSDDIVMVLVAIMASYGLRDTEAIHAIRGFRSMLHGFVSLEAGQGFGIPLDLDESFDRATWIFIHGLRHRVSSLSAE